MELNQLKTILSNLTIPEEYSQPIMAKATAMTMNTTGFLGTIMEDPIDLNPTGYQSASSQATLDLSLTSQVVGVEQAVQQLDRIGDYDDLGMLGEGGMGSVRLIRDRKLNRRLAMKIIHPKLLSHTSAAARFAEEAQVCAQLQHPNIVPVHDFGTLPDGRLFFTMKEIKGRSLDAVIRSVHAAVKDGRFYPTSDGWTFRRLIDVFYKVCQAIGYAHAKGVLHRDLKPENIMLGEFGEVLVVDWGIAKVLGRVDRAAEAGDFDLVTSSRLDSEATRMGQVAGTPAYMAPEQAHGEIDQLNAQTDVYALGAILYEILCGRAPYRGSSVFDVLEKVKSGPPVSVVSQTASNANDTLLFFDEVSLAPSLQVPEALVEACEVAMSRLQSERYESAEELGEILQNWLEGAKKREKAIAIVNETEALALRRESLNIESKRLLEEAEAGLKDIPKWADESVKGPHWAKEREGLAKARAHQRLDHDIEYRLQSALSHKVDLEEAHEALGQRYLQAHQDAERERDESKADQSEIRLCHHALALPEGNAFRQRALHHLKGTGAVSLITDVEGIDITLDEYVPHHRRLVPKRIAHLGSQGLSEYPLEMGSYRLVLKKEGYHDVIYPVHITRGAHWDGRDEKGVQRPVHMPKLGELGEGECFVPRSWFWCGGDPNAMRSYSRRQVWVDDFVMSRFQVSNRDYLVFLNSLLDQGREEEALQWVPREPSGQAGGLGSMIYGRGADGRFILVADLNGDVWALDWPVSMVTWHCAEAYCRWKSKVSGHAYRLPTELEWEKSARGVDGRWHVWGDGFDPSYCHTVDSHHDRRLPALVNSYSIDESVYGVRGLAGNMSDWTSSLYRVDWTEGAHDSLRVLRGGCWGDNAKDARTSFRVINYPADSNAYLGFRLLRKK